MGVLPITFPLLQTTGNTEAILKRVMRTALVLRLFCNPLGQHKPRADYKPAKTQRHPQYSPWCCPAPGPCMTPGQLDRAGCNTSSAPAMKVGQQCRVLFQEALWLRQHLLTGCVLKFCIHVAANRCRCSCLIM